MREAKPKEAANLYRAVRSWRGPLVPGSTLPKYVRPTDFDFDQLAIGTTEELEHTRVPGIAMEIAMGHLLEDERYYDKLERMLKK